MKDLINILLHEIRILHKIIIFGFLIITFIFIALFQLLGVTVSLPNGFYNSVDCANITISNTGLDIGVYGDYESAQILSFVEIIDSEQEYKGSLFFPNNKAIEVFDNDYGYDDGALASQEILCSESFAAEYGALAGDEIILNSVVGELTLLIGGIYEPKISGYDFVAFITDYIPYLTQTSIYSVQSKVYDLDKYFDFKNFCVDKYGDSTHADSNFEVQKYVIDLVVGILSAVIAVVSLITLGLMRVMTKNIIDSRKTFIFQLSFLGMCRYKVAFIYLFIISVLCVLALLLAFGFAQILFAILSNEFSSLFGFDLIWSSPFASSLLLSLIFVPITLIQMLLIFIFKWKNNIYSSIKAVEKC